MNGDISNQKVANAQAYFAGLAAEIQAAYHNHDAVNRVYLRGVKRLWISSMTDEAIKQGFQELKEQENYQPLYLVD